MVRRKVVLIGVDGATWHLIDELIEKGELPEFRELQANGTRARLKSIPSTFTSLAWPTISTGKFYDNIGMVPPIKGRYSVDTLHLWDILELHNHSIGLMNWHVTYPPRKVNGFYVPGGQMNQGFTETYPENHNTVKILRNIRDHPSSLDLRTACRGLAKYALTPPSKSTLKFALEYFRANSIATSVKSSILGGSIVTDVFLSYYRKHKPDFSAIYLNATDIAAHKAWHHYQPGLFPNEDVGEYSDLLPDAYRAVDQMVGKIRKQIDDNTAIFVISDHGTGPAGDGDDVLTPNPDSLLSIIDGNPQPLRAKNSLFLFCNNEERAMEIENQISSLTVDGKQIFLTERPRAPTIELQLRNDLSVNSEIETPRIPVSTLIDVNELDNQWGTHTDYGIFLGKGPGVKRGETVGDLHLTDITPTLLHYFDIPIGEDMDGSIKQNIFSKELETQTPKWVPSHDSLPGAEDLIANVESTEIDEREIKSRLEDLGYI